MGEYLTAADIRKAVKYLEERMSAPYHPPVLVIHPRESWKAWVLGDKPRALRVWRQTKRYLTWREWWGDRPWK